MIERQFLMFSAILAGEAIAQEDVEPRERRLTGRPHILLERHDRGQTHLEARAFDGLVVFRDDVHAVKKHRLDCVLPAPQRERIVAQRPVVGVEHERGTRLRRDGLLTKVCSHPASSRIEEGPDGPRQGPALCDAAYFTGTTTGL